MFLRTPWTHASQAVDALIQLEPAIPRPESGPLPPALVLPRSVPPTRVRPVQAVRHRRTSIRVRRFQLTLLRDSRFAAFDSWLECRLERVQEVPSTCWRMRRVEQSLPDPAEESLRHRLPFLCQTLCLGPFNLGWSDVPPMPISDIALGYYELMIAGLQYARHVLATVPPPR